MFMRSVQPQCQTLRSLSQALAGIERGAQSRTQTQSQHPGSTTYGSKIATIESDVMILFTSSVHHYITPKFYTTTGPLNGRVVPTWNYAAVQVYGRAKIYHDSSDPSTSEFLIKQLDDLARESEELAFGYPKEAAWQTTDAPDYYVKGLLKGIIGIEIEITDIEGRFKMSQDLKEGDRKGVYEGFEKLDDGKSEVGEKMVEFMKERKAADDKKKEAKK